MERRKRKRGKREDKEEMGRRYGKEGRSRGEKEEL